MKTNLFITGTDTEIGKTYTSVVLLKKLNQLGKKTIALKPVSSGVTMIQGRWLNEDQYLLTQASSIKIPYSSFSFQQPIAPHLANYHEKKSLSVKTILQNCYEPLTSSYDVSLIEGAGGLMVPLNEEETWIDFIKALNLPVILVVGMRLGCLNHALLTSSLISHEKISYFGWIANCLVPSMNYLEENIETLKKRIQAPFLGRIAYLGKTLETEANYF